jgi:hypothetical protein
MARIDDLKRMVKEHGDSDACLIWPFATNERYGKLLVNGKLQASHVTAFEIFVSKEHLKVLHTCDNGFCFNPRHLFSGTQTDNMRDCIKKGRFTRHSGVRHPKAKQTAAEQNLFESIRKARESGETIQGIADRLDRSYYFVWTVINRRHKTEKQ